MIFQQNRKSDSRAKKISAEKIFWKWTFDFSTIFGFGHISAQVKSTPSKEPFSRARTNHQIVGNLFYSCTRIGPNDIFSAQSGITTSGLTLIVLKVHLFLTTKHTVFGQVRLGFYKYKTHFQVNTPLDQCWNWFFNMLTHTTRPKN